jgi:hypothetical protein
MNKQLFLECKTDEEKYNFFLSGQGYATGVVAVAIQNDVAMAYQRCAVSAAELRRLHEVNQKLIKALKEIANETYDEWTNGARAQRIAQAAIAKAEVTK